MPSLIPSLMVAGLALAAAPVAADPLDVYQEAFATAPQPATTRVVHDGGPYAEAFSASPAVAAPARPALATSAAPYTERFADTSSAPSAKPEAPAAACACLQRDG
ncbi:MAG TPA: hypothetical protein VFR85_00755 [Anaeromyxobacteraceae bacterium]|nr:hypothetical protein [Anaeromyxobacteraceae bacterium]